MPRTGTAPEPRTSGRLTRDLLAGRPQEPGGLRGVQGRADIAVEVERRPGEPGRLVESSFAEGLRSGEHAGAGLRRTCADGAVQLRGLLIALLGDGRDRVLHA